MLKNRKENKVMIKGVPANINELKTKANNKSSWRERLSAVNVLKEYDCVQSKDILARLAINDPVFKVKEKAFRAAQALGGFVEETKTGLFAKNVLLSVFRRDHLNKFL